LLHDRENIMRRTAFTLVELLVVIAILVALLAILMPSMARASFVAQETVCASGFRQKTIAVLDAAADRFGSYHAGAFTGSVGLNPWGYDNGFLPMLASRGVGWELWFCPLQPHESFWSHVTAYNVPVSVVAANDDKAVADYMLAHSFPANGMTIGQFAYLVPRKAANGYTPHNGLGATRDVNATTEWPTSTRMPGTRRHALMSDSISTHPTQPKVREASQNGHRYGGKLESINAAWPDGSVRRRPYAQIELVQDQHWGIFY
jgi:prepilin-type N-terminal cleavage/methylation domain-containing protein